MPVLISGSEGLRLGIFGTNVFLSINMYRRGIHFADVQSNCKDITG